MKIKNKFFFYILFLSMIQVIHAQDLLDVLEAEPIDQQQNTIATFKGTRISIGHSVETRKKGALEISTVNRFWNTPEEESQSFAADKWNSRIGVDYAISDRFTIGTGYGTGYRSVDVFGKYRLFYQRDTGNKFPFSITLFQGGVYRGKSSLKGKLYEEDDPTTMVEISAENKFATTTQLLISRKISRNFSLQIAPTYVYRAEDKLIEDNSPHHFSLGFGGRYKVSNHLSIVSEYYYVANPVDFIDTFGAFALGANWEVSDLLLQFKLTNARNVVEDKFIIKTENNFNFRNGNLHFGFQATYFIQL
ncbi:DUF5777 family beta-barrel protein [Dokdonia sp.]|uniref:DUF5777 family beta-barrel protein n=1 Tax=Dokdonia sp. TaxID=2024995 RepID=UPI003266EDCC